MNNVCLIGNVVRDVELRQTQGGISTCNFTIAVNRPFTNANGERDADFIQIHTWRATAESCAKYLHKGSKVGITGSIQTNNYTDKNNVKRYETFVNADKVEFLGNIGSGQQKQDDTAPMPEPVTVQEQDDLPF